MTRLTPEREAGLRRLMSETAWAAEPGRPPNGTAETHRDLRDLLAEIDALREGLKDIQGTVHRRQLPITNAIWELAEHALNWQNPRE